MDRIINQIQNSSPKQKQKLVVIGSVLSAVILIVLWVVLARFSKPQSKDMTLFNSINSGIKNVKDNYRK